MTGAQGWRQSITDYVFLTKPWIMSLLLFTAVGGMVMAAEGMPSLGVAAAVVVGGALASGGASALNHALEREVDTKMRRTHRRPVASLRISPRRAALFGVVLNLLAFLVLWRWANLLSALLALAGTLLYIFVYTRWLKRSTVQNIVIGGAAGALPPLVGWAAVTGGLNLPAYYLFAIVFFWTPPHFWALSLLLREDYAAAGIPMLPVVEGGETARRAILLYTLLLMPLTLLLFLATDRLGPLYLVGAMALGAGFLYYALQLLRHEERAVAARMYRYSLLYLPALFALVMVDAVL